MAGKMLVKCMDYDGHNPKQTHIATGIIRYVDIEDDSLYYSQVGSNR